MQLYLIPAIVFTLFLSSDSTVAQNDTESEQTSGQRFLILTPEEKAILEVFREKVAPSTTDSYMLKDDYLLRFLKHSNFNLTSATNTILEMLKWRKENRISQLLTEDYSEFETDYNIYLEGCDYDGRPVISVPFGTWDIRRAVLAGRGPRLQQFMDKIFEDATSYLRSVNDLGVEIYQATLIVDLEGFDMKTHACPKCIPIYLYFFTSLGTHYPGLIEKIHFVNSPQIFNLIWDFYKDVFTPELKAITTVYELSNKGWKTELQKSIPESSLSKRFGGVKPSVIQFFYVRSGQQIISSLNKLGAIRASNNCVKDFHMYETLMGEMNKVMDKWETMRNREIDWCPNTF